MRYPGKHMRHVQKCGAYQELTERQERVRQWFTSGEPAPGPDWVVIRVYSGGQVIRMGRFLDPGEANRWALAQGERFSFTTTREPQDTEEPRWGAPWPTGPQDSQVLQ